MPLNHRMGQRCGTTTKWRFVLSLSDLVRLDERSRANGAVFSFIAALALRWTLVTSDEIGAAQALTLRGLVAVAITA